VTAHRRTASHPSVPSTIRDLTGRLLAAALAAAGRGWHVFPLRPDSKRPAFPDHTADRCTGTDRRCHDGHTGWEPRATTNPDRIRRAWTAAPYGIGVACGPSSLLVVDLDRPKPGESPPEGWRMPGVHDGSDVLALLAERARQPFPADTYIVRTGSGGTHLYAAAPAGAAFGNTAGDRGGLGWLVDTRGSGGYVVAAGSTADGHPYTALTARPPAPLPAWLARALARPAFTNPAPAPAAPVPADWLPAYVRAALAGELAHVAAATEGSRNHTLFTAAAVLSQLVADGALPAELVTAELEQAAERIGLGRAETAATIRSGLRAGAQRPHTPGRSGRIAA
jgi:Bifunctional DNA primase/polymerase, N-terminal